MGRPELCVTSLLFLLPACMLSRYHRGYSTMMFLLVATSVWYHSFEWHVAWALDMSVVRTIVILLLWNGYLSDPVCLACFFVLLFIHISPFTHDEVTCRLTLSCHALVHLLALVAFTRVACLVRRRVPQLFTGDYSM